MEKSCTNCLKKYEKEENCSQCGKALKAEFICVKIKSVSAHFCSKECADKNAIEASYRPGASSYGDLPQGYECKKCGFRWVPDDSEAGQKLCPECASPDLMQSKNGAAQGKS